MAVIMDQIINIRWSSRNANYYKDKGFEFTKYGDEFQVSVSDIPERSQIEILFECDYCKEVKSKKRSLIRYLDRVCCNDTCRKMFDRKRTEFVCPICETVFERNDTQIAKNITGIFFCSRECSNKYDRKDPEKWMSLNCEYCDQIYEVKKSQYDLQGSRFCSVPCRNKWESENKRGENHPMFRAELVPCTYCKKENYVCQSKLAQQDNHFCDTECRQKWYAEVWSQSEEWKLECSERAVRLLSEGKFGKDSGCQNVVNKILNELEIKYENEYSCRYYSMDNFLIDSGLMIEVMGSFWHSDPRIYKILEYQHQVDRIKNDKAKNSYIRNNYGIEILYLWEYDISNRPDVCVELIKLYIIRNGVLDNYHSFNYSVDSELNLRITEDLHPYFYYTKKEIQHLIKIKDISGPRSMKQHDKWITFSCDNCGDEREELISHYNKNQTHFCSKECAYKYRKGKPRTNKIKNI